MIEHFAIALTGSGVMYVDEWMAIVTDSAISVVVNGSGSLVCRIGQVFWKAVSPDHEGVIAFLLLTGLVQGLSMKEPETAVLTIASVT